MKKKVLKEAIPLQQPSGKKGAIATSPQSAMTPDLQGLADKLQSIKKSLIVQDPQGKSMKVQRNPDGTFSLFLGEFSFKQSIGARKMPIVDVMHMIDNFTRGKKFEIPVAEHKKSMNSIDLIRKDLLRRKIQEHFSINPKSKSVIIRSSIGGNTVWKVSRKGKEFNIVEVNTARKEYVLSEAVPLHQPKAAGTVGGQSPGVTTTASPGQSAQQFNVGQFSELDTSSKMEMLKGGMIPLNADSITITFADFLKPGVGREVVALRDIIQQNAAKVQSAAKGAVGSALGFLTNLSNQKRLMGAGKQFVGDKLREAEEIEPETEPEMEVGPPDAQPMDTKDDSGLEASPVEPQAPEPEAPKTGEQMQLDQLVGGKPVQNIDVFEDDHGDHVVLSLAGLTNDVELIFPKTGGIKYKMGDLVRIMKSSGTPKDKE